MSAYGACSSRLGQEMEGIEQGRWLLIDQYWLMSVAGVLHMLSMGPCGGPLKGIPGGDKQQSIYYMPKKKQKQGLGQPSEATAPTDHWVRHHC